MPTCTSCLVCWLSSLLLQDVTPENEHDVYDPIMQNAFEFGSILTRTILSSGSGQRKFSFAFACHAGRM
jgi:hypothetical protein